MSKNGFLFQKKTVLDLIGLEPVFQVFICLEFEPGPEVRARLGPCLKIENRKSEILLTVMNILLDRDGTVIQDRHYVSDPDQVHLLPGTGPALRSLLEIGCRLFLITNQSGIGRGFFTLKTFLSVQERFNDLLASEGVYFEDQVYCPHTPEAGCSCRKPEIMMWKELVHRHGLQPERSVMIGDKEADLAFGAGAGLGLLVLVLTGYGRRTAEQMACPAMPGAARVLEMNRTGCAPDLLARDLPAACAWIRKRLLGRTSR